MKKKIQNLYLLCVCCFASFDIVESFKNRSVNLNWTTISFDFDANPPPSVSLEQSRSSSMHVSPSSPILNQVFDNEDTTASLVYILYDPLDALLCEPFIGTPEPSLSPAAFETVDYFSYEAPSPNHMSYEPSLPNEDDDKNKMSYETSSPVTLLPMLILPSDHDANSQFFVPTFELAFMDDDVYDQFFDEYQPQLESMHSVYERSDRTFEYEQL